MNSSTQPATIWRKCYTFVQRKTGMIDVRRAILPIGVGPDRQVLWWLGKRPILLTIEVIPPVNRRLSRLLRFDTHNISLDRSQNLRWVDMAAMHYLECVCRY
jgi:hypothetical protein